MFTGPVRDVGGASLRVAVMATGLVLVAYLVIAGTVMMIVNRNLTTAVDTRLQSYLSALTSGQPAAPSTTFPSTGAAYRDPLLRWVIFPGGQVYQVQGDDSLVAGGGPLLPAGATSVGSPQSLRLPDGSDGRFAGATTDITVNREFVHNVRLVVGQSTENLAQTQNNILIAELIVGPILLIAVFLGALTVGRRVGSPIEMARQRQVALTADASHELRTPLAVIEAQTSLALERERDPEWYRRAFQAVGVESKRMRKLVDDMLWLARFDSEGADPGAEPVDLGVLAAQSASRFEAVAEAHGQTLRVTVAPAMTVINAPPEWLDRLLGVLLDNATRYTPAGGSVEVMVDRRDGRVRLAVDDSGPGIPPEERAHIFDRFHRASDTPGGSGLGLSIADAVVRASGGRWDVGASQSGGASMAVSWPPLTRGAGAVDSKVLPAPPAPPPREVGAPAATSGSQA